MTDWNDSGNPGVMVGMDNVKIALKDILMTAAAEVNDYLHVPEWDELREVWDTHQTRRRVAAKRFLRRVSPLLGGSIEATLDYVPEGAFVCKVRGGQYVVIPGYAGGEVLDLPSLMDEAWIPKVSWERAGIPLAVRDAAREFAVKLAVIPKPFNGRGSYQAWCHLRGAAV